MHGLSPIALLMVQICAVVIASRLLARLVRALGQPSVIAEVLAGIVLGPSVLGLLWPASQGWLFPEDSMPGLALVARLGLVFFMFLVGLELDTSLLVGKGRASLAISWASIVTPFGLGVLLAVPMHRSGPFAPEGVAFLPFALFLGAAMSVTAFPVLARILAERGLLRTPLGAIALSCAAVDDVTAWCILAFVVSIARAEGLGGGLRTTAMALAYVGVVVGGLRPLLGRLGPRQGQSVSAETVAIAFVLVLASASATEWIGIHALFGAFLLGAVMPRGGGLTQALTAKVEDFVTLVLLPLFFAYSGLRTRIGLLDDPRDWAWCLAVVLVACLGKFGGSAGAARWVGLSWRDAGAVGVLMNTRGLMELIVLNVGLDLGVLTPRMFTMMVIMALVTTWITAPLLAWIHPRAHRPPEPEGALAPGPAPARVMLCVSDPATVPAMVAVGRRLAAGEALLALHVVRSDRPSAYLQPDPEAVEAGGPLAAVAARAAAAGVEVRPLSVVAEEPAADIARVAAAEAAELIVLGTHRPLLTEGEMGGVVRRVMGESSVDVAVLLDRGLQEVRAIRVAGGRDPAIAAVRDRLLRGGAAEVAGPGPETLLVAPIGAEPLEGESALLVRPRA